MSTNCQFHLSPFTKKKKRNEDFEQPPPLSASKTAQKTPEFIGIKFATKEKTSIVGPKNIKSGQVKQGEEVVVNFNGKEEKAAVIVLSGKCTVPSSFDPTYTRLNLGQAVVNYTVNIELTFDIVT